MAPGKSLAGAYVAFVPLRAGSQGLPGKNIRPFAGLPLYEHAVRQGLRCCGTCYVSTDIDTVLEAGGGPGRVLFRRPATLAGAETPMDAVLGHAIREMGLEHANIVLLQATSPLRRDATIHAAIDRHRGGDHDLVLTVTEAERGILKWGLVEAGRFLPVRKPEHCFQNRQDLPAVWRPTGAVYVFSAAWFLANGGLATERIGAVPMPAGDAADIDDAEDFRRAEAAFSARAER
ncbi:MAG: acylneuraminate cytidylyltransferase family protein [Pseudomonadota bacterium]